MANLKGWQVNASEDGQYLYVRLHGMPGQIHIKSDDEGFVVDIWTDDEVPEVAASTFALYPELEGDIA